MIDLHCHPLPFLDDGAADWDIALQMAALAAADGVTQWVTTPHWTGQLGEVEKAAAARAELQDRLQQAGIPLRIHSGNEVILVPRLAESLREGSALTLAGSRYLLLETAQLDRGAYLHSALFQLQSLGYRIILAHPERLRAWQADLQDLRELVRRGCYLQVNAGSLLGTFGHAAHRTAERLVELGWVSFLATDAHSADRRPPLLTPAVERCARLIGDTRALDLVTSNPARVLCDEHIEQPGTEPTPKRVFPWFPWPPR